MEKMGERSRQAAKKPETKRGNLFSQLPETNLPQPQKSPISSFLHLQRTIGNQAVGRLLQSGAIQAKFKFGQPEDKYKQEADSVADRVMSVPEPEVSRQEDEEEVQTKPVTDLITPEWCWGTGLTNSCAKPPAMPERIEKAML